jgi:hypothetical protein
MKISTLYPSGAKVTVTKGPGWQLIHWELPYHEGSIYDMLLGEPESPNPVDIRRAGACQGESVEPMAQSCAMVPAVESQQTLKK